MAWAKLHASNGPHAGRRVWVKPEMVQGIVEHGDWCQIVTTGGWMAVAETVEQIEAAIDQARGPMFEEIGEMFTPLMRSMQRQLGQEGADVETMVRDAIAGAEVAITAHGELCGPDGRVQGVYLERVNAIRHAWGLDPYEGPDFPCTGSMTGPDGRVVYCSSPAHREE